MRVVTLATDGCDRATAYHMANKIVRRADGLYVTWLDRHYRIMVGRCDAESGRLLAAYPLAQGSDNHCGAALAQTPDGRLHAMAGAHGQAFVYRWSERPDDSHAWSLPEAIGMGATYPSLVSDRRGVLHLAYRGSASSPWGVHLSRRPPGAAAWDWPYAFLEAPAPLYTFPTNSLAVGADGTLHLVVEFYKTYPPASGLPARSMAVAHFEWPEGAPEWRHTDGQKVTWAPVRLEDTAPVTFKADGNLRPGNVVVRPDGQPAFAIFDALAGTLSLLLRSAERGWRDIALTETLREIRPDLCPNFQAQLAMNQAGDLVLVAALAPELKWAHPGQALHVLWLDPYTGAVRREAPIPKLDPGVPDWLASIQKSEDGRPPERLHLLYTSGANGPNLKACTPSAVRLVALDED